MTNQPQNQAAILAQIIALMGGSTYKIPDLKAMPAPPPPPPMPIAPPTPKQADIASSLLSKAIVKPPGPVNLSGTSGPSVIDRVFDVLSRGNYAVANIANTVVNNQRKNIQDHGFNILDVIKGNPFNPIGLAATVASGDLGSVAKAGAMGLAGKDKTTFSKVIQNAAGPNSKVNPFLKYGGGLAADIAFDPTTYVGPGLIKGIGRAFGIGKKAVTTTKDTNDLSKAISNIDIMAPSTTAKPPPTILGGVPGGFQKAATVGKTAGQASGTLPSDLGLGARVAPQTIPFKFSDDVQKQLSLQAAGLGKPSFIPPMSDPASLMNAIKNVGSPPPAVFKPPVPTFGLDNAINAAKPVIAAEDATRASAGVTANSSIDNAIKQIMGLDAKTAKNTAGLDTRLNPFGTNTKPPPSSMPTDKLVYSPPKPHEIIQNAAKGDPAAIQAIQPKASLIPPANGYEKAVADAAVNHWISSLKSGTKLSNLTLNQMHQAGFYDKIMAYLPNVPKADKQLSTLRTLVEVEKNLEAHGIKLTHNGDTAKLSSVIAEMGHATGGSYTHDLIDAFRSKTTSPNIANALDAVKAQNAAQAAPAVEQIMNKVFQQSPIVEHLTSPAAFDQWKADLSKVIAPQVKAIPNAGPNASKNVADLINGIMKSTTDTTIQGHLASHLNTILTHMNGVPSPKGWQTIRSMIDNEIRKTTGVSVVTLGDKIGPEANVIGTIGSRLSTSYGMKNVRPVELDHLLSAERNADLRGKIWRGMAKSTTLDERVAGFHAAQDRLPSVTDPTSALGADFKTSVERLFGSTGLKNRANNVATRAGMTMQDLNDELRKVGSTHYFTKEGDKYKEGANWLNSWQDWKVTDDPINLMTKLELATERLTKKYALYDDIAGRWGTKIPTGENRYKIGNPRFDGVYFNKQIASEVQRLMHNMNNMYEPGSGLIKFYSKVLRTWKTHVTIYNPAHHIKNGMGDIYNAWIAGVNNPHRFTQSAQVLKAQKGRYGNINDLEQMIGVNAKSRPGVKTIIKFRGQPVSADDMYIAMNKRGILLSSKNLEDLGNESFSGLRPFGGKVHDAVSNVSALRDHWIRGAHFIDKVAKSKAKTLDEAFDEAAHSVRKFHPDGMDMTNFEKKLKLVVPFYSWTRKAVPLMLEAAVMKPGKVVAYPKANEAFQGMAGIDSPSRSDPFPTDQMFPDWIREKGMGPIAATGMGGIPGLIANLSRQGTRTDTGNPIGGYTVMNPGNPFNDIISQFGGMGNPGDPIKGAAQMVSPFVKDPAEMIFDKNLLTGAPVSSDYNRYITEQIPMASLLSRIGNVGIAGPTNRGTKEGLGNNEGLINWLTGLGITGTGPYQKQAKIEEGKRVKNQ